jgi:hypothetical protein
MIMSFRAALLLLAISLLTPAMWGQKAGGPVSQSDAANCASLFITAPSGAQQILDLCHGVASLDYTGEAWIQLPDGFYSHDLGLHYELTAVGKPAPNLHVAHELSGDRFHIAGGRLGQKVSWQVIGARTDVEAQSLGGIPSDDAGTPASR